LAEIKVIPLKLGNGEALVNVEQRDLMLEVIEKSIAEERKDEKIEMQGKHDGIWHEG
jgi:hypothetical protein